jgi:ABC-type polysaccharide/polyol phosphate export permease
MFISRLIMLATPIFYSISGQIKLFYFNLFNPLYFFITVARDLIIYDKFPELWLVLGLIGYSLLSFFLGLLIFNKLKIKFAEMI